MINLYWISKYEFTQADGLQCSAIFPIGLLSLNPSISILTDNSQCISLHLNLLQCSQVLLVIVCLPKSELANFVLQSEIYLDLFCVSFQYF